MRAGIIERAFQLASRCQNIEAIRAKLRLEGYTGIDEHLSSGALMKDLNRLLQRRDQQMRER